MMQTIIVNQTLESNYSLRKVIIVIWLLVIATGIAGFFLVQ